MKLAYKSQMVIVTITCIIFYILFIWMCLYLLVNVDELFSNNLVVLYVEVASNIFIYCSIYGAIYTAKNYFESLEVSQ